MSNSKYSNFDYDLSQKILTLLKVSGKTKKKVNNSSLFPKKKKHTKELILQKFELASLYSQTLPRFAINFCLKLCQFI